MIIIGSVVAPTYQGGLAAYERTLGRSLECRGSVTFFAVNALHGSLPPSPDELAFPLRVASRPGAWNAAIPRLRSLASRPRFHLVLEWFIQVVYSGARLPVIPRGTNTVHFIGTGWDLLGFALFREARRTDATCTVWPAIHPGTWGDDVIDIRFYRTADHIFCQSGSEQSHLANLGIAEDKLVRCGLPPMCRADGNGLSLRSRLRIGDRPIVLFLGRREAGKGYPSLLKAWRTIVELVPDAVLIVGGTGACEEDQLTTAVAPETFHDLGVPDEQTKADAFAACDIFCLPSMNESFGIVYVEAWSYGKPVVCGMAPASRELIEDGKTGLWSDGTPESVADKLVSLLRQPASRASMGEAGRRLQQRQFTQETMVASHLAVWGLPGVDSLPPPPGAHKART